MYPWRNQCVERNVSIAPAPLLHGTATACCVNQSYTGTQVRTFFLKAHTQTKTKTTTTTTTRSKPCNQTTLPGVLQAEWQHQTRQTYGAKAEEQSAKTVILIAARSTRRQCTCGNRQSRMPPQSLSLGRQQAKESPRDKPGAGIKVDDLQVTTVFTVKPSFHHRRSTNRVS